MSESTRKKATSASVPRPQVVYLPLSDLKPSPQNPRLHSKAQLRALAKSIATFGFTAPILLDRENCILGGHARLDAAVLAGLQEVPVIFLEHLSKAKARAYVLADNRIAELSNWDETKLAIELKALSELALDFDLEDTGFELPEIDLAIQSLEPLEVVDRADDFEFVDTPPLSRPGDLWLLGPHRVYCGSSLDAEPYAAILKDRHVSAVFTDPPYNVKIDGHVSGAGAVKHREFAMAAGEMDRPAFTAFLSGWMAHARTYVYRGGLVYTCMDWRHMGEMLDAAAAAQLDLLNLCVWVKSNGGMGSLYRSRHELVFVFRNGDEAHTNNVQLGRFGRNRTNVWHYTGANAFRRRGQVDALALHPTVKPVGLVADALLDATKRDDLVLDPFLGSGTTLIAAERTKRRCAAIEFDPLYVDTAIRRWERFSGEKARHADGATFAEVARIRGGAA